MSTLSSSSSSSNPCLPCTTISSTLPPCTHTPTPPQRNILDKYGVELIGAKLPSIDRAEDRELFKQAMMRIGLKVRSGGGVEGVLPDHR